jgi:hypothetical protein
MDTLTLKPEEMVPAPAVAEEFNITRRTLGRWFVDPKLDFPQPTEINRRLYFPRSSIEGVFGSRGFNRFLDRGTMRNQGELLGSFRRAVCVMESMGRTSWRVCRKPKGILSKIAGSRAKAFKARPPK